MNREATFLLTLALFLSAVGTRAGIAQVSGIDVLHYAFELNLNDRSNAIQGQASIDIAIREGAPDELPLDLIGKEGVLARSGMTVRHVTIDGQEVSFSHEDDVLRIPLSSASSGRSQHTFEIAYEGVPADGLIIDRNMHGDRTFFGDNWPNRARHWLPSIDHPSDKATVEWIITAPDHYQVVANGILVEERDHEDGIRTTHWRTEVPLPTKVMVFGAARFAVLHEGEYENIPVQAWVYPQDRDEGYYDFSVTRDMLAYFIERIGPFPYEKMANVQSKTRYGGMENASVIFYNETRITGERQNENTVAHEIAHQWFGDSVTEADWPHIWLSEGFASYFTQLYVEHAYGREQMNTNMASARDRVIAYANRVPEAVLVDNTPKDPNQHLNTYSYQKGSWVLHMLRGLVGDQVFWQGIRNYYETYRDANATSEEFQAVMEDAAGSSLESFFAQWLYQPGHPVLDLDWSYDAASGVTRVALTQVQKGPAFIFPVFLQLGQGSEAQMQQVKMTEKQAEWTFEGATNPGTVILDPGVRLLFQSSN